MKTQTETFTITTSPDVMIRLKRFLALLHWNSRFGHSALFGMSLDGDGNEKMTVEPMPEYRHEVDLVGSIGGDVEIARTEGFAVMTSSSTSWQVRSGAVLYKNGNLYKAIPSALYEDE